MIADVGGTRKVRGSRIATPLTEPRPGAEPMKRPITTPTMMTARLIGWIATSRPSPRSPIISIMVAATSVDYIIEDVEDRVGEAHPLGKSDPHQRLEEEEEECRHA